MKGGIFTPDFTEMNRGFFLMNQCKCGQSPVIVWHYVKGTANHINYFAQCQFCKSRTRNRKRPEGALEDWNNELYEHSEEVRKELAELADRKGTE